MLALVSFGRVTDQFAPKSLEFDWLHNPHRKHKIGILFCCPSFALLLQDLDSVLFFPGVSETILVKKHGIIYAIISHIYVKSLVQKCINFYKLK